MSVKVIPTSKAMSDLGTIADHVKKYNDAATARKIEPYPTAKESGRGGVIPTAKESEREF